MKRIYLDYAAATPMDPEVLEAMRPYFAESFYNPSATYLSARAVRRQLDGIRAGVAGVLGAKPAEVVFTAGATEANNLAIQGVMRQFPGAEVLVSTIEHDSVLEPAKLFGAKQIPVDDKGAIKLDLLSNLISDKTKSVLSSRCVKWLRSSKTSWIDDAPPAIDYRCICTAMLPRPLITWTCMLAGSALI
jgi:cysteine desulfurase